MTERIHLVGLMEDARNASLWYALRDTFAFGALNSTRLFRACRGNGVAGHGESNKDLESSHFVKRTLLEECRSLVDF